VVPFAETLHQACVPAARQGDDRPGAPSGAIARASDSLVYIVLSSSDAPRRRGWTGTARGREAEEVDDVLHLERFPCLKESRWLTDAR